MNNQIIQSEALQVLSETKFRGEKSFSTHSRNIERELELLDAISLAIATGEHGEFFAAALHRRGGIQLVLSKNGIPTKEDIAASTELIFLLENNAIEDFKPKILPFLIRRCGTNIRKRMDSLDRIIKDEEVCDEVTLALETYVPDPDLNEEYSQNFFTQVYGDNLLHPASTIRTVIQDISQLAEAARNNQDTPSFTTQYWNLFEAAFLLNSSRFLKTVMNSCATKHRAKIEKLQRRLGKVCQHFTGMHNLLEKGKRLLPISLWVTDPFGREGENTLQSSDSPIDAISRVLDYRHLNAEGLDMFSTRFPYILKNWTKYKTADLCIHAEIRILLYFGLPVSGSRQPIGCSKRSCMACTLFIKFCFRQYWMISRFGWKPCADWAIPSFVCPQVKLWRGLETCVFGIIVEQVNRHLFDFFPIEDDDVDIASLFYES